MIPSPSTSPVKMLVIDGREDLPGLLPANLNHVPVVVTAVKSVETRFDQFEEMFDVVIADIDTPDLDDVALLKRIREEMPDAKVIVVSSGHHGRIVPRLLRQNAYSILIRPIDPARLEEVIEQAVRTVDWEDDIELLSGTSQWVQVRVACKLQAAERAAFIFYEVSSELGPEEIEELVTAFRELLMNAIEHGGRSDPDQSIFVNYIWTEDSIVFYIRDPGPGFSFGKLEHAAISHPNAPIEHAEIRERQGIRPGGFGIMLAKNYVDELIYSERGNEVILIKHRRKKGV